MHDIRAIRDDALAFDAGLARRGHPPVADALLDLDRNRREALTALQEKQARRNAASKEIGAGRRNGQNTSALEAEVASLKADMERLEAEAATAETGLRARLAELPNLPDPTIPDGPDETANAELKRWGTPRETNFPPLQHFELGERLQQMSFDDAARIAGARFVVLRGALARLERALGQFMLDLHVAEHGFTETSVPILVNEAAMFGTGQLPKFRDEAFVTTDNRWLAPTSEVPLTNLVSGKIIPDAELPIRMTALTQCFRSEAGSAGRDTRGMLRQHQFQKVELVSIVRPDESDAEHERMTRAAETVLERLELPYRRMLLCAGDTGFASARTHDLEVWLPGQGTYREVSSISNIRAFQARRMNARTRPSGDAPVTHVHTLNGSALAIGRTLIAILENHQQQDGSITLPAALHPYMAGRTAISPLT